jgi:3-deoxy-D-manno-octulosonic-acid transferase
MTPFLIIFFSLRERSKENITLTQRLGFYQKGQFLSDKTGPRIWIHAASVGEVNAIIHFVRLLRQNYPQAWIGISTMTLSGLEMAQINLPEADGHFLAPFDLFFSVRRAMRKIQPNLYITVETEIWPNHLRAAKSCGACVLMINGRISARTINIYKKFRRFFQRVLFYYDYFSMIRVEDAERIQAFGAEPEKLSVNGNIKFDRLSGEPVERTLAEYKDEIGATLHLSGDEKILVAGSTKKGEEELLLQAFKRVKVEFPDLYLIIAPREIHRGAEIGDLVRKYGYTPLLRTEISSAPSVTPNTVIILNTIGELFKLYSLATLVYCGGSLVPLGGQNPLEPAFWGKVVLYGFSMGDFLDAKALLEEAGSGIQINNADELYEKAVVLLRDEDALRRTGEAGRKLLQRQQGASQRNLALVEELLRNHSI